MKVKADHWVNHNGVWYQAGETYDDGRPEIAEHTEEARDKEPEPVQTKRTRKKAAKAE